MTPWYFADDARRKQGPCDAEAMRAHFRARRIRRDTLVWREGLEAWTPLDRVASELDLDSVVPDSAVPPPLPPPGPVPASMARTAAPKPQRMSGCLIALLVCAGLAVPMVGILAAIAIPAYQDYVIRAKVAQTIAQAAPLQAAVASHMETHRACPDRTDATLAGTLAELERGPHVQSVRVGTLQDGACAVELTLRGIGAQADGKTLLFATTGSGDPLQWDCTGGDLPGRHRPAPCRPKIEPGDLK